MKNDILVMNFRNGINADQHLLTLKYPTIACAKDMRRTWPESRFVCSRSFAFLASPLDTHLTLRDNASSNIVRPGRLLTNHME